MAQKNLIYNNGKSFVQSDPYADDLTLRSFSGRLFLINSHSSVSADVFRVRNLSGSDVAIVNNEGNAIFHNLQINGFTHFSGNFEVEGTTSLKNKLSFCVIFIFMVFKTAFRPFDLIIADRVFIVNG
jgi:hypothetical protein